MEQRSGSSAGAQPEAQGAEARAPAEAAPETSSPSEACAGAAKELSSDHEEPDRRRPAALNVRDSDYPKRTLRGKKKPQPNEDEELRRTVDGLAEFFAEINKCARRYESKAPKGGEPHEQQLKKRAAKHKPPPHGKKEAPKPGREEQERPAAPLRNLPPAYGFAHEGLALEQHYVQSALGDFAAHPYHSFASQYNYTLLQAASYRGPGPDADRPYLGYPQFLLEPQLPFSQLPKSQYTRSSAHVYIAYNIWRLKGNEGKDPTEYARSIKEQVYQKRTQQDASEFIGNSQMINEIEKNNEALQLDPHAFHANMTLEQYDAYLEAQRLQALAQAAEPPADAQEQPQNKMDIEESALDLANQPPDKQDPPESSN